MGFNFNNKLIVEIDGNKLEVNISNPKIVVAFENMYNVSSELAKCNTIEMIEENNKKLSEVCKELIRECVGFRVFEELCNKQNLDIADLIDLSAYLADEITKFKQAKLNRFAKQSNTK